VSNFLNPDKAYSVTGVTVKDYLLTEHNPNGISMPSKRTKKLIGVTVHNTDVITVKNTTMSEQYTRATVNGNMKDVRVHYYVDNVEAWHNLPNDCQGWHAADGSGNGNTATIAIECIMAKSGYEKSEDNAARLAAYILHENGLTIDNLYTHTYWLNVKDGKTGSVDYLNTLYNSYKTCPAYIIPHWSKFKATVKSYLEELSAASAKKMYYVQVGAFASKANAEKYLEGVKKDYPEAFIKVI